MSLCTHTFVCRTELWSLTPHPAYAARGNALPIRRNMTHMTHVAAVAALVVALGATLRTAHAASFTNDIIEN